MVKDREEDIQKYVALDERLKHLDSYIPTQLKAFREFSIDRECSNLFVVREGRASAATGWRENRENREVTGAVMAEKGEFVFYLPGEPMALKADEGSSVLHWRLK